MRWIAKTIVVGLICLAVSGTSQAGMSISILGAPASGKGFYFDKLKASGWEDILNSKTLTVDVLRDQFLAAPFIVKLYEIFKTADFVKSLAKEDSGEFSGWLADYYKVMEAVEATINRYFVPIGISVALKKRQFHFYHAGQEVNVFRLLTLMDVPLYRFELAQVENELLGSNTTTYNRLKRVIRNLQYEGLKGAVLADENIVFDETGDEPSKLAHRINILDNSGYSNLVIMIHPKTILINYLQNAYRMIQGIDGGRDSSASIADAYNKIDEACGQMCGGHGQNAYAGFSRQVEQVVVSAHTDLDTIFRQMIDNFRQSAAMRPEVEGVKPIDLLFWITLSDVEGTINRLTKSLPEGFDRDLLFAIVKLHLDNRDKTTDAEREKLQQTAPALLDKLNELSKTRAFAVIFEAKQRKETERSERYAGITNETIEEARKVWHF